jgi:hypothetical protein
MKLCQILRSLPLLVLAVLLPLSAQALLVYEPFDYAAGTAVTGLEATGLNLTGSYTRTTPQDLVIASPGLDYGNLLGPLPGVAGNRLSDASGGGVGDPSISLEQNVAIAPGQALFFSALFTFDDSLNGTRLGSITLLDETSGDRLMFGETVAGIRTLRVEASTAALGDSFSDSQSPGFVDGQTLWLIGRYQNSAAAGGDTLDLIGYDTADAEAIATTFDPLDPSADLALSIGGLDIDFALLTTIRFDLRGTNDNFIDELRVGDSYASVAVPEPASALLLGLGLVGLATCRRR